jgi:excisionase family DNA binding protein
MTHPNPATEPDIEDPDTTAQEQEGVLQEFDSPLTVGAVSRKLTVSTSTVYSLLKNGELGGYRIGNSWRIPSSEVGKYLSKCRSTGGVGGSSVGAPFGSSSVSASAPTQKPKRGGRK